LIGESSIIIKLRLLPRKPSLVQAFIEDLRPHLIVICDGKARQVRENIYSKPNKSNLKYKGTYHMTRKNAILTRSVKESIHIIDTENEEVKYMKKKFSYYYEFINVEARNIFKGGGLPILAIKCCYGFNYHASRDNKMNRWLTTEECPRCSQ